MCVFVLQVHRCEFKVWRVSAAWMASFTSLVAGAALPQHAQKHIFTHTPTHRKSSEPCSPKTTAVPLLSSDLIH